MNQPTQEPMPRWATSLSTFSCGIGLGIIIGVGLVLWLGGDVLSPGIGVIVIVFALMFATIPAALLDIFYRLKKIRAQSHAS